MQTPITDFVKEYAARKVSRFHMPGHKGQAFLGCESLDITEIAGADALYEADGIIEESEKNATQIFESERTVYSTEGSSQCIRAMVHLLTGYWRVKNKENLIVRNNGKEAIQKQPYILAGRNVHKAFLYAAALVDLKVVWLYPEKRDSLCSCEITAVQLEEVLREEISKHHGIPPVAVYVTSPDYLGGNLNLLELARVCHEKDVLFAVDNAHGAYLHFLKNPMHPMDLGADLCCDSAHKTLPVLTGGAYLHIRKGAPYYFVENVKQAMALFGSTSPSYLILTSLDLCNLYLENGYRKNLAETIGIVEKTKEKLRNNGWQIKETDPLKITLCTGERATGTEVAEYLRQKGIECEYADEEFLVLMATPENVEKDYHNLYQALENFSITSKRQEQKNVLFPVRCRQICSVRDAIFSPQEVIKAKDSIGRVCGIPTVGCPPAIPIAVAGEVINEEAVRLFEYYGIEEVSVLE